MWAGNMGGEKTFVSQFQNPPIYYIFLWLFSGGIGKMIISCGGYLGETRLNSFLHFRTNDPP
jgi:hypothetical protein